MMPRFWDFSLQFYSLPGVATACIRLQDTNGADVSLLLFALWAARCGLRLGAAEAQAAEATVHPWRETVVRPLRIARRATKGAPAGYAAGSSAMLHDRIKAIELEAERLQQDALAAAVRLAPSELKPEDLMRENLAACASLLPNGLDPAQLAVLVRAFLAAPAEERRAGSETTPRRRLIVGISGASGTIYGARLLRLLRDAGVETHLVVSRSAQVTMSHETAFKMSDLSALADVTYPAHDIAAAISSGSFRTLGMVIAPCSMRSLSEIVSGTTATLLTRAADVVLKERRRLVLLVRETPLHLGHLRSMAAATEMGAVIYPPVPAFYARPNSLDGMVDHTLGRVLDLFDLDTGTVTRWGEPR